MLLFLSMMAISFTACSSSDDKRTTDRNVTRDKSSEHGIATTFLMCSSRTAPDGITATAGR